MSTEDLKENSVGVLTPFGIKKEARLFYLCIDMLRTENKEGFTDENLSISRSGGEFRIEGVLFKTEEEIRVGWARLPVKLKLTAEEPGLDVEPLYDTVIIRPFEIRAFSKTTLQIPDGALSKARELSAYFREMPLQGIVVAVGPGWITEQGVIRPVPVEVGDHVAVRNAMSVSDFLYNGKIYYEIKATTCVVKYPLSYTNKLTTVKFDNGGK